MCAMFSSAELRNDIKVSLDGIHTICVKASSQSIVVYHTDESKMEIKEYMSSSSALASEEVRGDAYCIEYPMINWNLFTLFEQERIELYIPLDFKGQIYLASASGSVSIEQDWELENIEVHNTSGAIRLGRIQAQHLLISNTSGSINIVGAAGDRQITTVSGSIRVGGGVGNTKVSSSSGKIQIVGLSGAADVKSTSGGIDISYQYISGQNTIRNTSGHIQVQIPSSSKCIIKASSTSGGIHVDNACTYVNHSGNHRMNALTGCGSDLEAAASLDLSTVSGRITVTN